MSVVEDAKFKCPHCEHVFETKMYKNVAVSENPVYRGMLINGDFFRYVCPNCRNVFMAVYPLVYTDVDNKFILQYTPIELKESVLEFVKENKDKVSNDYTIRVCDATYDMVEKLIILENRLDDRAVECCKVIVHKQFQKEFKDKPVNHIYINCNEKGELYYDVIFVENEKEMVSRANFDIKMYNQIYKQFRKHFKDEDLVVDYPYALELMLNSSEDK